MSFARPGIGGIAGPAPVAIGQRSNALALPFSGCHGQRLRVLNRLRRAATVMAGCLARMPSYLAWRSSSTRACCWASSRSRDRRRRAAGSPSSNGLFPAQMRDVGSADHDLGRHATDIDAGAADGAAFDQRRGRLARRLSALPPSRAAAADHGHMQVSARRPATPARLVQRTAVVGRPANRQPVRGSRAQFAVRNQQVQAHARVRLDLDPPLRIGTPRPSARRPRFQSLLGLIGARRRSCRRCEARLLSAADGVLTS